MKANLRTGILTATFAVSVALAQTPSAAPAGQQANPNAVGGSSAQKLPPGTPTWNPGFGEQIPNKELSGQTPRTNSTLQGGDGDMGNEYFGWLGLLGLAGLFGLSRGTNPSPRPDIRDEKTLKHLA